MAFTIFVKPVVKPEFVADCHLTILPVCPVNVKVVEFVPVQTGDDPVVIASVPPTDTGDTVIVPVPENVESHTPDLITAL